MPKKLGADDIEFILDRLAAYRTIAGAVEDLKKHNGVELTERRVYQLQKEHSERLEFKREQYNKYFNDTPIARARFRLDAVQKIYDEALGRNDVPTQLEAISTAERIAAPLGLESAGRGASQEVEDFLASVAVGQADH